MEAQPTGERVEIFGAFGQFSEDFHFDSAEESLGGPEGEAGLQDVFRRGRGGGHVFSVKAGIGREGILGTGGV